MASDAGLKTTRLDLAYDLIQKFLNPVLAEEPHGEWDPANKSWQNL